MSEPTAAAEAPRRSGADLAGARVLLGVTGSIAAYKSAELVRLLVKAGAQVQCVMTRAATEFIRPLTLEVLSGRPVHVEMFGHGVQSDIWHIELGREIDVALVAPATASFLARYRAGIVDDMLANVLLALDRERTPLLVAPAMNDNMLNHPSTQDNLEVLRSWGVKVVSSEAGELACKVIAEGRLAELPRIVQHVESAWYQARFGKPLAGRRVVITTGPTREAIDPVRFISNPSTGRMGRALAHAAWCLGAEVTLIAGPACVPGPYDVHRLDVINGAQMGAALRESLRAADVLVMAAAVGDYRPIRTAAQKIKKSDSPLELQLDRTEDLLAAARAVHPDVAMVGFAAETENIVEHAQDKLVRKGLDLIVGNRVGAVGTGFGAEATDAVLIDSLGRIDNVGLLAKSELAFLVFDALLEVRPELRGAL